MAGSHLKFGKNEGPDESITEGCPGPFKCSQLTWNTTYPSKSCQTF
jgi:hypothetical protein